MQREPVTAAPPDATSDTLAGTVASLVQSQHPHAAVLVETTIEGQVDELSGARLSKEVLDLVARLPQSEQDRRITVELTCRDGRSSVLVADETATAGRDATTGTAQAPTSAECRNLSSADMPPQTP